MISLPLKRKLAANDFLRALHIQTRHQIVNLRPGWDIEGRPRTRNAAGGPKLGEDFAPDVVYDP